MKNHNNRYARHYSLKDFGFEGQQKLAEAKVLVIGAGGLGCPVLQYLTAAGVGTIGLADNDVVSLSNLQRQVLYSTEDIGRAKASVAAVKLQQLNPDIIINSFKIMVTSSNALELIADYDIVIDCTDNFAARYLINDACVLLYKPLVFGAVYQYEGQVAIFNVPDAEGNKTNYRNLFATPPDPLEVADCNEAGVLGVLPGIIGIMQATEAIKLLTGIGETLINKLLTFSILDYSSFVIDITADESANSTIPKNETEFKATDYNWLCGMSSRNIQDLKPNAFLEKINLPDTIVIDVRETGELPKANFQNLNIPLSALSENIPEIEANNIILFCQSGKRSLKAGQLLLEKFGQTKNISHLKGGIIALHETINEQTR
ncbi:thiamine biosynthesis protein ThiF [Flavobacterium rivuli WB 3.3-2 = DSM 21788]|uniref:Molybdopterin-synthase adenylyltransferase n=1 Tax=Flavobacterium rivuli WB 3.3-2 = DSM 21788 TaxID=1121895 RepID=A0A0A2M1N9_9FLAO|nr:HesA/MoeB/ThiF family protein [Flavobacterium rivuli]KGO85531.1 thiamine biosynthesis protein ThiF [Flavobacterium rivuli WB 3.3-2 = DSM 21788]